LHNLWHLGIPFILEHTDHHPPNFRNTWRRHLKNRNRSNFLRLQAHTIQAITDTYTLSINSTPFWWLLFHFDMLIFRHADTCSLHCHRSLPQIYTRHHQRTHQRHLLRPHQIRLQHGYVLQETFTNTIYNSNIRRAQPNRPTRC
jgi:hypothetical protein